MKNCKIILFLFAITGFVYPLIVTLFALLIPFSNGSFIYKEGKIIGSELIGQKFSKDIYFKGRPSANDYDALKSGGTNKGPLSVFKKDDTPPKSMLYASASGLDPHMTYRAALYQAPLVAKARNLELKEVEELIVAHIEKPFFKLFGEPVINVLKINLALDEKAKK